MLFICVIIFLRINLTNFFSSFSSLHYLCLHLARSVIYLCNYISTHQFNEFFLLFFSSLHYLCLHWPNCAGASSFRDGKTRWLLDSSRILISNQQQQTSSKLFFAISYVFLMKKSEISKQKNKKNIWKKKNKKIQERKNNNNNACLLCVVSSNLKKDVGVA